MRANHRDFLKCVDRFVNSCLHLPGADPFFMPSADDLKWFRKRKKKTQIDVEKATGVPRSTIISLERGNNVNHDTWVTLCEYYKTLL